MDIVKIVQKKNMDNFEILFIIPSFIDVTKYDIIIALHTYRILFISERNIK